MEEEKSVEIPETREPLREQGSIRTLLELLEQQGMERFFNGKGKEMIGWDEIIEGGLSKTATVMWWRSWVKDAATKAIPYS